MNQNITRGIGQIAQGYYKVMVVGADGKVVGDEPQWQRNLILNQGMDHVAVATWAEQFEWAIAGTGTRVNSYDSSTDVASQSGTTVTSVGGIINFTTDAVAGDMIRWDSGSEARITSITGALIVEVTPSQSVGSGAYTVWKTAQVGLQTEIKRTQTYLTGSGNCESSVSGTTMQMRRTYDFSAESGGVTYTEVGVGWAASLSTTVFSRILLNSPIALVSGQKLRLVYQLNITLSPSTPVLKNLPVGGWPVSPSVNTDGQEQIQRVNMSSVNTNGQSTIYGGVGRVLDPHCSNTFNNGRQFALSTNSSALAAFGSSVDRSTTGFVCSAAPTESAYVSLSFSLDLTTVFAVADGVSAAIRAVCLGYRYNGTPNYPYDLTAQSFTFLFDQAQTKTNTQTLTFTVRFTWGRVLA